MSRDWQRKRQQRREFETIMEKAGMTESQLFGFCPKCNDRQARHPFKRAKVCCGCETPLVEAKP